MDGRSMKDRQNGKQMELRYVVADFENWKRYGEIRAEVHALEADIRRQKIHIRHGKGHCAAGHIRAALLHHFILFRVIVPAIRQCGKIVGHTVFLSGGMPPSAGFRDGDMGQRFPLGLL